MGDYHRTRWKALQNTWEASVFAADLGAGDKLYGWHTTQAEQYILLSEKPLNKRDGFNRIRNFTKYIRTHNIEYVCIPGYGRLEYIVMLLLCKIRGKKVLLFAESWYPDF